MKLALLSAILLLSVTTFAQKKPFRFAFISDTHIGSPNGGAEEDLRLTIADINSLKDIDFVVLTGDITELGTDTELGRAKQLLDSLHIPYYIIPGNHDTGWSESGGLSFSKTFGDDKFYFRHKGVHFIGCASGPYVRMSDGHVPRSAVNWMAAKLEKLDNKEPVIFLNHYPLDNGLDNWYEIIDLLKTKNSILALCGHGHTNKVVQAEDVPAVMGRSNLRAKETEGGYNLVDVRPDSIVFTTRKPVSKTETQWTGVAVSVHHYAKEVRFPRPDFSINKKYPQVKALWIYQSAANVISTPVVVNGQVIFGNQNGLIESLNIKDGKPRWTYQAGGPIFSSPASANNSFVVGSADGKIYCLTTAGKLKWSYKTGAAVLGSPLLEKNTVYIGGSDHHFRALDMETGKLTWQYDSLKGPVVSKPVMYNNTLIFGAWDTYLYAYDLQKQHLLWKWTNGSPVINFSPASCVPVVKDSVIYIAAPDRYLTAIDMASGKTLWRTKEAGVRESIGMSEDGQLIYGKTMQDTITAFYTNAKAPQVAWKMNAAFGYEHTPSMLVEKEGLVFFGTRSGVVYAINPTTQTVQWAYKIDNSMVNTVNVLTGDTIIASTMDGKVCLLKIN